MQCASSCVILGFSKCSECQRHGSHLAKFCENLITFRTKYVNETLFLSATLTFLGWNFFLKFGKNIKDAVVLGWGRQISEKSRSTIGITAITVNACQWKTKHNICECFSSRFFQRLQLQRVHIIRYYRTENTLKYTKLQNTHAEKKEVSNQVRELNKRKTKKLGTD